MGVLGDTDSWLKVLSHIWYLWVEMSPYLLLGFAGAGLLHRYVKPAWVEKQLGGSGLGKIVKATLFGVPLPLCSCSVIPVAISIHKQGASRGASTAFLASTPQTGVDSIAATVGLMGPVFAVLRICVAFISGIAAGVGVAVWGGANEKVQSKATCTSEGEKVTTASSIRFAYLTLPRDIGKAMFLGVIIAGVMTAVVPEESLGYFRESPGLSYVFVTLVAIPLYVCSTGSIPLAFAWMNAGLSPGAALIFLIAGPATNAVTVSTLWKMMGKRVAFIYLVSIVGVAWVSGALVDLYFHEHMIIKDIHIHEEGSDGWSQASGILLLLIFFYAFWPFQRRRKLGEPEQVGDSQMVLQVDNMSCHRCVERIKGLFTDIESVTSVEVYLDAKQVIITGDDLPRETIEAKLKADGYRISLI